MKLIIGFMLAFFLAFALVPPKEPPYVPNIGEDYYYFATPEYTLTDMHLTVKLYGSFAELQSEAARRAVVPKEDADHVVAFAVHSYEKKWCSIHMVKPTVWYLPRFYGHELLHCVYGNFHKGQDPIVREDKNEDNSTTRVVYSSGRVTLPYL